MSETKNIVIPINKVRLRLVGVIYALIAVAIAFGFYYLSENFSGTTKSVVQIAGVILAAIILLTASGAVKLLSNKNAGVTFLNDAIVDMSSSLSPGEIKWKSISEITVNNGEQKIIIRVKNPDYFIKNAKNKAVANLQQLNLKQYGSPIILEQRYLSFPFPKISEIFKDQCHKQHIKFTEI